MIDELLAVMHVGESIAVTVLIWRSLVADRERTALYNEVREMRIYLQSLIVEMLRKTDITD